MFYKKDLGQVSGLLYAGRKSAPMSTLGRYWITATPWPVLPPRLLTTLTLAGVPARNCCWKL